MLCFQIQHAQTDENGDAGAHPNHKNSEESIDVSSSIGVSHDQPGDQTSGLIEDLLANESNNGEQVSIAVAPGGPASLSHAAVVDSDTDLLGAESDTKFSLAKFKRPVREINCSNGEKILTNIFLFVC